MQRRFGLFLGGLLLAQPLAAETPVPLPATATAEAPGPVDPRIVIKELTPLVLAFEKAEPTLDSLRTTARLARAHAAIGEAKPALRLWTKLAAVFEQGQLAKDGGPAAALAAEAHVQMLEANVQRSMKVSLSAKAGAARDLRSLLDEMLEETLGARPKPAAGGSEPQRQGGLVDQLLAIGDYKVPQWRVTAEVQAARVLLVQAQAMRDAVRPSATHPAETASVEEVLAKTSQLFDERALGILEKAWRAAEAGNVTAALRTDLRKELNRLRPNEYPLAEGGSDTEAVTPGQREASRLASLAQKSDRLDLRLLYLSKAVKLDPANPRYLSMLQAAQAEQKH